MTTAYLAWLQLAEADETITKVSINYLRFGFAPGRQAFRRGGGGCPLQDNGAGITTKQSKHDPGTNLSMAAGWSRYFKKWGGKMVFAGDGEKLSKYLRHRKFGVPGEPSI